MEKLYKANLNEITTKKASVNLFVKKRTKILLFEKMKWIKK